MITLASIDGCFCSRLCLDPPPPNKQTNWQTNANHFIALFLAPFLAPHCQTATDRQGSGFARRGVAVEDSDTASGAERVEGGDMSTRTPCSTVFVGNIFYEVTEDMLVKMLSEVGPVKSFRLVCDRETGKPKGFGFCEFFDVMTADSAVRNLNGRELGGRTLRVDFADEGTKGGPEGSGSARQSVGMEAATAAAVSIGGQRGDGVAKVLADMSKQQLWELLEQTKNLVQQNPQQARQLLVSNPALTKALFQSQIILGIIKTPEAQGGMGAMNQGMGMGSPGMPPQPPYPGAMMGGQGGFHPQQVGGGMMPPQQQGGGMNGGQHMRSPMGMAPGPPGQGMPHHHPQMQMQQQQQQQMGGMDQQQMLLQQLLSMTPDQIDQLPPEQKQQVLAVQAQLQQG